ncbi:MAG: helix-turn-helix domain-containing protein [Chloroflexi bacterium]|nr:MAG: helix-turn-helix domain-containing protein [Chloroflexota bacterium]
MPQKAVKPIDQAVRIGEAAELLGVSVDTLRRWTASGRLRVRRSAGGQRLVALADIRRLQEDRRKRARPIVAQSARNRFPGVVTRVDKDRVAAVVEVQAGPHRLVSLMTAEAATELELQPGAVVVCVVKATNVVVEIARRRRGST